MPKIDAQGRFTVARQLKASNIVSEPITEPIIAKLMANPDSMEIFANTTENENRTFHCTVKIDTKGRFAVPKNLRTLYKWDTAEGLAFVNPATKTIIVKWLFS